MIQPYLVIALLIGDAIEMESPFGSEISQVGIFHAAFVHKFVMDGDTGQAFL